MSTRSVTFIHKKGVTTPTGEYVCKLYRHWDGYVNGGLGDELVKSFDIIAKDSKDGVLGERDIFRAIANIDSYEFTEWIHSDAEYVYHIYDKDDNGLITITYQHGYDETDILKTEEIELYYSGKNTLDKNKKKIKELTKKIEEYAPDKLGDIVKTMENFLNYGQ